jgi:hypothetical protein
MGLSTNATKLMERLNQNYRETGNAIFNANTYMDIPDYPSVIEELIENDYISWKNEKKDVIGSIVLNLDSLD